MPPSWRQAMLNTWCPLHLDHHAKHGQAVGGAALLGDPAARGVCFGDDVQLKRGHFACGWN